MAVTIICVPFSFAGGRFDMTWPDFLGSMVASTGGGGKACLACGMSFGALSSVRRHFFEQHDLNAPCYACPFCKNGRIYKNKRVFGNHIASTHPHLKGLDESKCAVKPNGELINVPPPSSF